MILKVNTLDGSIIKLVYEKVNTFFKTSSNIVIELVFVSSKNGIKNELKWIKMN